MIIKQCMSCLASGTLLACLSIASIKEAGAQICAMPATLTVNSTQWFDTCQGESSLVLACGTISLYGPAVIVHMPLPYPIGRISVQTLFGNFDPAIFMLRSECSNSASCGQFADTGLLVDTLDLATLDSGDYFLAIAPPNPSVGNCGQILVTYSMTAAEAALAQEGLFRGGGSTGSLVP